MLDEKEFAAVRELYLSAFPSYRGKRPLFALRFGRMDTPDMEERFRPMLELYHELTGFEETNANAILHHRLALYGPACAHCGKPLRTPRARFCAACGATADTELTPT